MKFSKIILLCGATFALAACEYSKADKTSDRGFGRANHLSTLQAGIWVDPHGCDHWIIDDGVEGYLSARLDDYGNPVCSGIAPPTYAVGQFRRPS